MPESFQKALWYQELPDNMVECRLCRHYCRISPSNTGRCRVRLNRDGILYSLVAHKLIARHLDPIEKKPLYHFHPGSKSYSIGTMGCNMTCMHCQNFEISQVIQDNNGSIKGDDVEPREIVREAKSAKCKSIAYTYTEPTIFLETVFETARLAREAGIKNCLITNGYIAEKALQDIAPYIDAVNVDLKAYSDKFYIRFCGARLEPVLENIRAMIDLGIWVEVTTLLIPSLNDSLKEMEGIALFLAESSPDIPWHISRFKPNHQLRNLPATPIKLIRQCRKLGIEKGLRYVYSGNVPGDPGESTYCPKCGQTVIERFGYTLQHYKIRDGKCMICGHPIKGVGM
jgi:pyruvate formate lyase activating enzyme